MLVSLVVKEVVSLRRLCQLMDVMHNRTRTRSCTCIIVHVCTTCMCVHEHVY